MTSSWPSKTTMNHSAPTMVTLVAETAVRQTLLPFLDSSGFVIAIQLPSDRDISIYKSTIRNLLDPTLLLDDDGNTALLIDEASDVKHSGWMLDMRYGKAARVILLYVHDTEISRDLALMIDRRISMHLPNASHFKQAANTLKLRATDADCLALAACDLRDIQLALRPKRTVRQALRLLQSPSYASKDTSPAREKRPEREPVRLEELSGFGAAKHWGFQLAEDIAAWKEGNIEWQDVDKGIVLEGPSGCGKSTFPRALANTCGMQFVASSAAAWQATGHLGDLLRAMRKTFKEAMAVKPAILFIDELDSIGDREARRNSDSYDYKRQVINGLLECLDASEGREGVVVIGATNDASAIDAALLRPGRFEQIVRITHPGPEDRKAILGYHLQDNAVVDLDVFVAGSEGWSGADIEKVARDARRLARKAGRKLVADDDLLKAMPTRERHSEAERYRLAIHEVGHVVVGVELRAEDLLKVRISPFKPARAGWNDVGTTHFRSKPALLTTASHLNDTIAILLAGIAAERMFFGEHSMAAGGGTASDLTKASDMATLMERSFGFGDGLLSDLGVGERPMETLRNADPALQSAVRQRLDTQYERVTSILKPKRDIMEKLARRLMERLELSVDEIHEEISVASKPTKRRRA
jgi:cell division protease FtsH